jgi:hypothetical protein
MQNKERWEYEFIRHHTFTSALNTAAAFPYQQVYISFKTNGEYMDLALPIPLFL